MKKIRVLHLIKSLGRGGAETLLSETLRVHDRDAFAFHYAYFVSYKGQLAADLRDQGVRVDCIQADSAPLILARLPALIKLIRQQRIDVIHCHLPISAVAGRFAGQFLGIPLVYTEHNKQERYHFATRRANLLTMNLNAEILAVSEDVRQSLLAHWSGSSHKVRTLINGVNTSRYDPATYDRATARQQLGLPANALIVGTVCVFRTQKRLPEWLELAADLHQDNSDTYFIVLGDGPTEKEVKAKATALGLDSRILFPGRLNEVRLHLAAMDIYLMTSEFEGLPIAMLEAMSMALPVVSTTAGGIGEAIADGIEGRLSPVDRWRDLAPPLAELAASPAERARLGKAARQRVIKDFSIERMAGELETVYRRLAKPNIN